MKRKDMPAMHSVPGLYGFGNPEAKPIATDPLGSYTGRPEDPYETPVQDADDL